MFFFIYLVFLFLVIRLLIRSFKGQINSTLGGIFIFMIWLAKVRFGFFVVFSWSRFVRFVVLFFCRLSWIFGWQGFSFGLLGRFPWSNLKSRRRSGSTVNMLKSGSRGPASNHSRVILLFPWIRHFTLTKPLSTKAYKWVQEKCQKRLTKSSGGTCDVLAPYIQAKLGYKHAIQPEISSCNTDL